MLREATFRVETAGDKESHVDSAPVDSLRPRLVATGKECLEDQSGTPSQ